METRRGRCGKAQGKRYRPPPSHPHRLFFFFSCINITCCMCPEEANGWPQRVGEGVRLRMPPTTAGRPFM